jgi:RND superfamily putative drug exporter
MIGRMTVKRRRLVLIAWALLAVLGGVFGGAVFDGAGSIADTPPGTESAIAQERLDRMSPEGEVIVAVIAGADFFTPGIVDSASSVIGEIRNVSGVTDVVDAYTSGGLVGDDGRSSLVTVELDRSLNEEEALIAADRVSALLHTIEAPEIVVGGELLGERAFVDLAIRDAAVGEAIALLVVLVLLTTVLGGFRAGVLPVLVALASIAVALLGLAGLVGVAPINEFAVNVVTMLGIGLAVDYSLLVIARFRDEREVDPLAPLDELMARTVATAGRAVLVSGLAVCIALLGMLALGDPLLSGMAVGGAVVVLVNTVAGLTLVPAAVAVIHRRIPAKGVRTWARPWGGRAGGESRGLLARSAGFAQQRAAAVAIGATAALLLLAAPLGWLTLGSSDINSLPARTEERRAHDAMMSGFEDLGAEPVTVLIDAPVDAAGVRPFLDDVAALPEVDDAMMAADLPADVTVVEFAPVGDATGAEAQQLVREIRQMDSGLAVQVAGPAAEVVDTRNHLLERLPLALGIVFVSTFGLLFALTRSVIIPLKALVLSALTIAATLGILVALFQWGWGSSILGFAPWGALDVTTPLLISLLAFGLAMDYQVFLISRIQEKWRDRDPDLDLRTANDRAVLGGITASGPVVTTAALSIGIVFLGFAFGELLAMKEVGVGMAIALLLDVTVVRGLLLPATMTLLGRWNWWRPGASATAAARARRSSHAATPAPARSR